MGPSGCNATLTRRSGMRAVMSWQAGQCRNGRRRLIAGKIGDAVHVGFDGRIHAIQPTACWIALVSSVRVNLPST